MFRSRLRRSTRSCRRVGFVPLSFVFVPLRFRLRFRPAAHRARSAVVSASSLSSCFAFGAPSAHLALQCPTVVVVLEDPRLATLRAPQVARDLTSVKCVCHSSHSARQASSTARAFMTCQHHCSSSCCCSKDDPCSSGREFFFYFLTMISVRHLLSPQ